jgi:hypothetical protein
MMEDQYINGSWCAEIDRFGPIPPLVNELLVGILRPAADGPTHGPGEDGAEERERLPGR